MSVKFFICNHCKKIITMIKEVSVPTICCGDEMEELVPNSNGAQEKHTPILSIENNIATVTVSDVTHPMEEAHFIQWIYIVTDKGIQKKELKPGDSPVTKFALLDDEKVTEVFAYCNLHGLWKK